MEALDNAWYGLWRPLTNIMQTFRACHLCTFNVATIFFGAIPTYGVLPYAMINIARLMENGMEESPIIAYTGDITWLNGPAPKQFMLDACGERDNAL